MRKTNKYTVTLAISIIFLMVVMLMLYVKSYPNVEQPTDIKTVYMLNNGNFEGSTSGIAIRHGYRIDSMVSHTGNRSLRTDATFYDSSIDPSKGDARASWFNGVSVKEGQKVFASAWIKTLNSNCPYGLRIGIDFKKANGTIIRANNGDFVSWGNNPSTWKYRAINDTVRKGEERITLWLQAMPYDCATVGWFDDVELILMEG